MPLWTAVLLQRACLTREDLHEFKVAQCSQCHLLSFFLFCRALYLCGEDVVQPAVHSGSGCTVNKVQLRGKAGLEHIWSTQEGKNEIALVSLYFSIPPSPSRSVVAAGGDRTTWVCDLSASDAVHCPFLILYWYLFSGIVFIFGLLLEFLYLLCFFFLSPLPLVQFASSSLVGESAVIMSDLRPQKDGRIAEIMTSTNDFTNLKVLLKLLSLFCGLPRLNTIIGSKWHLLLVEQLESWLFASTSFQHCKSLRVSRCLVVLGPAVSIMWIPQSTVSIFIIWKSGVAGECCINWQSVFSLLPL